MPSFTWLRNFDSTQWILFVFVSSVAIGIPLLDLKQYDISITDVLTLILFPIVFYHYKISGKRLKPNRIDLGVLIFSLSILISILIHSRFSMNWSVLGLLRVAGFYLTARLIFNNTGKRTRLTMHLSAKWMILLTVSSGIIGLILLFAFRISNPFILTRDYYYGLVPIQLSGLDGHPNGAAQLLFICLLIFVFTGSFLKNLIQPIIWLGLLGLVLTQAKSGLIYLAITIWILNPTLNKDPLKLILIRCASILLILLYLVLSHFYPVRNNLSPNKLNLIPSYFDTSIVVYQNTNYKIYPTHYTTNKIAAWRCWKDHPWTGIGTRNYLPFIDSLQQAGSYPAACRFKNPHSMYTGILAKFGWIGFCGLIILMITIISAINKLQLSGFKILFSSLIAVLFIDGFTADLEYHKIFWLIIAWLASYLAAELN